jgi:hypothetical protein
MGTLTNLFLQKQEDGSFRGFDILGSLEQPAQPDPQKPFAALVCGDIKPGDILLIGSGNLERLRGELRLKERLSTLPPVTATLEIKQDLEARSIPDHFVAGIITCHEAKPVIEPVARTAPEVVKSTSSIQELRASEAEVNEHLSPIISPVHTKAPEELIKAVRNRVEGFIQNIKASIAGNKTGNVAGVYYTTFGLGSNGNRMSISANDSPAGAAQVFAYANGETSGEDASVVVKAGKSSLGLTSIIQMTAQSVSLAGLASLLGGAYLGNMSTPGTPSGGGYLYVNAGALWYKGASGTNTKIANA